MHWYLQPWKKYAVFSGRARRREYWWFALVNMAIIYTGLLTLASLGSDPGRPGAISGFQTVLFGIWMLFLLVQLIPTLAVSVRRLHDTNRSGWWFLLVLIPIIGDLILLIFFCTDGTPGDNRYGPSPKAMEAAPLSAPV